MKKIISILLLAVIALSAKAQTQFRDLSFEEALATAAKEKKQVFIDFYTDWCGPCKNMAKNVFPQVSVGNYMNKNFVCVKYNAEKEGKELAKTYHVTAYPTFIIVDTQKKVLLELKGAMDGEKFINKIKSGLNPDQTPERMAERYNSGERTPELVNLYAMSKMEKGLEEEGFKIVNDYFNSLDDKQRLANENAFLYTVYTLSLDDPKAKFMIDHRQAFSNDSKEKINARLEKLYRSELITYFSGYRRQQKTYKEEEYQALKNSIKEMGMDKKHPYAPIFKLIECRNVSDDNTFLNVCEQEFDALHTADQNLLIMNLPRLIDTNDVATLKNISKFIRSHLSELDASAITLSGHTLRSIEEKIK